MRNFAIKLLLYKYKSKNSFYLKTLIYKQQMFILKIVPNFLYVIHVPEKKFNVCNTCVPYEENTVIFNTVIGRESRLWTIHSFDLRLVESNANEFIEKYIEKYTHVQN